MSNEQDHAATGPTTAGNVLARIAMPVRWRDLDAFNHVNNASYLTYLEEARLQWLGALPGPWLDSTSAPVLAAIQINYRRPIAW
ncbi:MAG: thioesterase, partial [Lysobacterales bacterium CG17_big_fil_post_rev_8_21_14_2_50_64_11]